MFSLNQATFLLLRVAEKANTTLNYGKVRGRLAYLSIKTSVALSEGVQIIKLLKGSTGITNVHQFASVTCLFNFTQVKIVPLTTS